MIRIETKVWVGLGLAGALAGSGLAGCAEEAPEAPAQDSAADSAAIGETGEGEGAGGEGETGEGEGGEGEGGVDFDAAATDPVVYRTALAIAEAHAIAAYDAFLAGQTDPAAEMFGHPVSEVLADMDPVFAKLGVADFKPRFNEASQAVLDGRSEIEVNERYGEILAAIEQAERKAPASDASEADIAARVTSNMIERAITMYQEAGSSDRYEPYLDGYGFYRAAASAFEDGETEILAAKPELAGHIRKALGLLAKAYPSAERPQTLSVKSGELLGAASRVSLAL